MTRDALSASRRESYTGERLPLLELVPSGVSSVLDVGCSNGAFGAGLKRSLAPEAVVWGIEHNPELAREARERLDRVLELDVADALTVVAEEKFSPDLIVFADVLEHLVDPWEVFDRATALLPAEGRVLVSIPNVAHWSTIASLLSGRWPRRERGIHDSTHLRFFGRKDVVELMNRAPVRLLELRRVYRLIERPHRVNKYARFFGWLIPNHFTYQYLAVGVVERRVGQSRRESG